METELYVKPSTKDVLKRFAILVGVGVSFVVVLAIALSQFFPPDTIRAKTTSISRVLNIFNNTLLIWLLAKDSLWKKAGSND